MFHRSQFSKCIIMSTACNVILVIHSGHRVTLSKILTLYDGMDGEWFLVLSSSMNDIVLSTDIMNS